jgi:putative phage-type endonuclease
MTDLQRTDAWYAERRGKLTASRVADMLACTKSGWGASRANYMAELVLERLTGATTDSYVNAAMQWGIDHEDDARAGYEFRSNATVELVGFVPHPTIPMSGASPDGLVGTDGLVEIKCPSPATHMETLSEGDVPEKYRLQMQWQMACTGRQWCDFVSFDPRFPEEMALFIRRVERDSKRIAEIEEQAVLFLNDIEAQVRLLRNRYALAEAA